MLMLDHSLRLCFHQKEAVKVETTRDSLKWNLARLTNRELAIVQVLMLAVLSSHRDLKNNFIRHLFHVLENSLNWTTEIKLTMSRETSTTLPLTWSLLQLKEVTLEYMLTEIKEKFQHISTSTINRLKIALRPKLQQKNKLYSLQARV